MTIDEITEANQWTSAYCYYEAAKYFLVSSAALACGN